MHSTAFVYDDGLLSYDLGKNHPFRPERIRACRDILIDSGMIGEKDCPIIPSRVLTVAEAMLFHTPAYVEFVKSASQTGSMLLDAGDTPSFRGCFEASLRVVGATLRAIEAVISGESDHAVNFSGGLHHAHRGHASGFCIFNDCAVGLAYLKNHFDKIAYIDLDAHHGDGVMYGFYDDSGILDIDIHQDGRTLFPGTGNDYELGAGKGRGLKINLPLPSRSGDDVLLDLTEDIILPMLRRERPEFIILQCGADGLHGDPLANLSFTIPGYTKAVSSIHQASHEVCKGRLVIVGGGGYDVGATARCWASEFIALTGAYEAQPSGLSTSSRSVISKVAKMKSSIKSLIGL